MAVFPFLTMCVNAFECDDGVDNDGDQLIDFPIDPGCSSASGTELDSIARTTSVAYTWSTVDPTLYPKPAYAAVRGQTPPELSNLIHFCWLDYNWYNYGGTSEDFLANISEIAQDAKEATDQMPVGHRALFTFWMHRQLYLNPADKFPGTNIQSPWMDAGANEIRQMYETFFQEYKNIGGEVDVFVLDDEYSPFDSSQGLGPMFDAIGSDPRYSTDIAPVIGQPTIANIKNAMLDANGNILGTWWKSYEASLWGTLHQKIRASYQRYGIFEPMTAPGLFPNATASNYGDLFIHLSQFPFPDLNGHYYDLPGNCALPLCQGNFQWYMGTHQAVAGYGRLGQITINYPGATMPPGVTSYPQTPFNSMRYAINEMRAGKLSSNLPAHPWIAYRNFSGDYPSNQVSMANTYFYEEMLFHFALAGTDGFMYWNPYSTPAEDTSVSNCLKEFDKVAGFQGAQTLITDMASFSNAYLMTGMRSGDRTVYRITFDVPDSISVDSLIYNEISTECSFKISGKRVVFPEGKIFRPASPASTKGFWVVQPKNAAVPYEETLGSGLSVDLGPDLTVTFPNNTANLNAAVSGAVGTPSIIWSKINGFGTVTFNPSNQLQTTATFSHVSNSIFTYTVRATVDDGTNIAFDDIRVQVNAALPTAHAGDDQTVYVPFGQPNAVVSLDASGSSAPAQPIREYVWEVVSTGSPDPDNIQKPVLSLPLGLHTFSLKIQDGIWRWSDLDEVTITVLPDDGTHTSSNDNKIIVCDDYRRPRTRAGLQLCYQMGQAGRVKLSIYSRDGRLVKVLREEDRPPESATVIWDKKNDDGDAVASGIYILQMELGDQIFQKKFLVLN